MWVSSSNLYREEVDINENKNFYFKVFKPHLYHFATFYLIGSSNTKTDTHHQWTVPIKIDR